MAGYLDLLQQYAYGNQTPAPTVPVDTRTSPEDSYRIAAARANNTGSSISDPVQKDMVNLTTGELLDKYGVDALGMIGSRDRGNAQYTRDRYDPAPTGFADAPLAVGRGFANSVGGIAALGTGLVNDQAGAWIAGQLGDANAWVDDNQSSALKAHRRANQVNNELVSADNKATYEQEKKTDGSFVAGLRRIGRDAMGAIGNAVSDGTILSDGILDAGGSLIAGGPASKGIRVAGSAALGQLLKRGVVKEAVALKASEFGAKIAMPATIGMMEAGGAYSQTVQQVMAMDLGDLANTSVDYQELIAAGWSPEDARVEIATSAGLTAAAIQFPVAAAAGKLVSKFEGNPFKGAGSLLGVAKNSASEAIEESIQSGAGQMAGNFGVSKFADPNQDMLAGVGEQAGLGALYGAASAGVAQGPSAAIETAVAAGKAGVVGAQAAYTAVAEPIKARVATIKAERAAASPISKESLGAKSTAVLQTSPELRQQIDALANDPSVAPEKANEIRQRFETLDQTMRFDPEEVTKLGLNPSIAESLADSTDTFDALSTASMMATNPAIEPRSRIDAAIYVSSTMSRIGSQLTQDLVGAISAIPDEHKSEPLLREYEDLLMSFEENPDIKAAIDVATKFVAKMKAKDLSEQQVATPDGQQAVKAIVSVAENNPGAVTSELADLVLEHARKGIIRLSPSQMRSMSGSSKLAQISKTSEVKAKQLELGPIDVVSNEILNDATGDDTREKSAAGHTKFIMDAVRAGNTAEGSRRLTRMVQFAEHMQNKVNALNEAYLGGNTSSNTAVQYRALTPNGKWLPSVKGVYISPTKENSVRLAQTVALEAEALGNMANELALLMRELGVEPIELAQLNPDLVGPSSKVAFKFQTNDPRKVKAEPTPTPVAVAEPAKVEPAQAQPSTVQTESKAPTAVIETKDPSTLAANRLLVQIASRDPAKFREPDLKQLIRKLESFAVSDDNTKVRLLETLNSLRGRLDLIKPSLKIRGAERFKRSEDMIYVIGARNLTALAERNPKVSNQIWDIINSAHPNLGALLKGLEIFVTPTGDVKPFDFNAQMTVTRDGSLHVSVSESWLRAIEDGTVSVDQVKRVILHEATHIIDELAGETIAGVGFHSKKLDFNTANEFVDTLDWAAKKLGKDGITRDLRPLIQYLNSYRSSTMFMQEVTAEIGALILIRPGLATDPRMNKLTQYFDELFSIAAKNMGVDYAGLTNTSRNGSTASVSTEDSGQTQPTEKVEAKPVERPEEKLPPEVSTTQRETEPAADNIQTVAAESGFVKAGANVALPSSTQIVWFSDLIGRLEKFISLPITKMMSGPYVTDLVNEHGAFVDYSTGAVFFDRGFLDRQSAAGVNGERLIQQLLFHELGHLVHQAALNNDDLSDSLLTAGSSLFSEFEDMATEGMFVPPKMDYIRQYKGNVFSQEFIAEAFRVAISYPSMATRAPKLYAEIKQLIETAGGKLKAAEAVSRPSESDGTGSERGPQDGRLVQTSGPQNVAEAFPNLYEIDKVPNWLKRAFKLPKQARSRLLGTSSPATAISDALLSHKALEAFVGSKLNKTLSSDLATDYQTYLGMGNAVLDGMNKRLLDFLARFQNEKQNITFEDALANGLDADNQVNGYARGKNLSTLEASDANGFVYNQELAEGAALAGLQWALVAQSKGQNLDAEDVAKILGTDEAQAAAHVAWFNQGVWTEAAKRELSNMIPRYWGLQADQTMPEGYVKGIPESMAAEVLQGMIEAKLLTQNKRDINGKSYLQFVFNPANAELFDSLNRFPSAIEEAVLVEPVNINHIGVAPRKVADTQLHGSPVALKDQQIKALEVAQNIAHKLNLNMLDFYEMLGDAGIEGMFGRGTRTGSGLNVNTAKSIEGYNRTVTSAFKNLQNLVSEMENYAKTNGVELAGVDTFFEYGISSVGRMQMQGRANPQASKLIREVLLPTWSTLDLSKRGSGHYNAFMLAIGQHLGTKVGGKKTHQITPEAAIAAVEEELGGKFAGLLDTLEGWTARFDGEVALDLRQEDFAPFKKILGDKTAPAAIHALQEYSRYLNSSAEEKASFKTGLYLEADGVTDGPINALVNLTAGSFKPSWVDLVNRGGLYLGSTARSLADYIGQGKAPYGNGEVDTTEDLYKISTNFLYKTLASLKEALTEKPAYTNINEAMTRVLADLLPDMKFNSETGELKFERGIAKNPLTVTVYGSGVRGIANKITAMAIEELYEKYPTYEDLPPEMVRDLKFLTTFSLNKNKFGYSMKKVDGVNLTMKDGVDFTLTPSMIKALEGNVKTMFAQPLVDAIGEVMGDAMETATVLRRATQAQSIFFKYAYRQAIADALRNKDGKDGTKATDFLSQKELGDIFQKLIKRFPMIETKTQKIWVGGSARADVESTEFGRGLDESLRTPGYVYGPENAGVSGIPFIVIATGDGQMILNALTGEDAPQSVLPVFDGINMKLDTIIPDSVKINKAVYDGWMENPVRAVEESYRSFVEQNLDMKFSDMSEDFHKELLGVFEFIDDKSDSWKDSNPLPMVIAEQRSLEKIANELDAKKVVLSKINMSVDHMASAGAPYVKTDGIELPVDPVAASEILNQMMAEELAKLPKAEPLNIYKKPDEDITDFLGSIGTTDTSGAKIIGRDELRTMVDDMNIPLDQKSLFRAAVNSFATQDWTVLFGNPEQIQSYAQAQDIKLPEGFEGNNGLALPGEKTVFLMSANSETLTHEMIHAATAAQVFGHYSGDKVHADVAGAVVRIEALMDDFLSLDPGTIKDPETQADFFFAKQQIEKIQQSTNMGRALQKTAALNEFMAWTLANQKLSDLARGTKVTNKLGLIVKAVMDKLKKLWRAGLAPSAQDDVYSNLRFNTLVLMQAKPKTVLDVSKMAGMAQFQASKYGSSDRLSQIELMLTERMSGLVEQAKAVSVKHVAKVSSNHLKIRNISRKVSSSFQANGFNMTQQEDSLFKTLIQAFALDNTLDANAQSRVQDMFRHVLETVTVEDFMKDPKSQDPAVRYKAQNKYDLIVGNFFVGKDIEGRSTLLPAFLALSVVSDEFRDVLNKLPAPKSQKLLGKTLDVTLTNYAIEGMDRLARTMSGEGLRDQNVLSAMNMLIDRLAESQTDRETYIEQFSNPVGNGADSANAWVVKQIRSVTQTAADKLDDVRNNTDSKAVKLAANVAEASLAILNPEISEKFANATISLLNKGDVPTAVRELVSEIVGRTSENAPIYDMIKKSRAFIQQLRQIYRERLPAIIAEKFTRPLKAEEWENLYKGMAKTDLAALRSLGSKGVMDILRDAAELKKQVAATEAEISQLDPKQAAKILLKSRELSVYMNTGKASASLLRNAEAVASLLGELPRSVRKARGKPPTQLVNAVDRLVTLYALGSLPTATRASLATLAATETAGMEFTLAYLQGQRDNELGKSITDRARLNHFKGYVPSEGRSGSSLIVSSDKHYEDLVARGYTRVGNYKGSTAERGMGQMGYYFAPLTGKSMFNQGIAQNIRHTFYGVDPVTGFSLDTYGAGRITEQSKVNAIQASLRSNTNQKEALLPLFDADGDVIGFERTLDQLQLERLETEKNLSKVLGIWRGRQEEEGMADEFNRQLVQRLHTMWTTKEFGRKGEYVNLLDPKSHNDPVITDAVRLLSPAMRKDIEETFGDDGFMVRKEMVNDAIGYRSASIGDVWTGVTRISPETSKVAANIATAMFGAKAYQYLVTGEKLWQNFVSDARTTIVVRSMIVPAANIVSNVFQLAARGVPLKDIARGMPKKLAEIHAYHQNQLREIKLEAEILANKNNLSKLRPLKAQLQAIKDSHKQLSIWPLIEAGEFTSVSEATVMRDESTLFEGKVTQYVEGLVDRLPPSIRTAGRYAIISRDTALFQGLQRTVEYGDFLAKAVLYDDLTKRQARSSTDALVQISEEYVNYDRLPGRFRGSLEGMGLLWFYHFKLRSMKVAMSMIRNNPLHTLMTMLVPTPGVLGAVGLPVTDNALAIAWDNKLGYSVGPMMGLHAHAMSPVASVIF